MVLRMVHCSKKRAETVKLSIIVGPTTKHIILTIESLNEVFLRKN